MSGKPTSTMGPRANAPRMPAVPAPCGGNAGIAQRKAASAPRTPAVPAPCGGHVGATSVQRVAAGAPRTPAVPAPCGGNVGAAQTVQRAAASPAARVAPRTPALRGSTVQRVLPDGSSHQGNITPRDRPLPQTPLSHEALEVREQEGANDSSIDRQYWHEAVFANGLVYGKTGSLSDHNMLQAQALNGKFIFVLTESGTLLLRNEPSGVQRRMDEFTHANFTGGQNVKAAGQIFLRMGKVIRMDNESGHYKPRGETLGHLLKKLNREGVDLTHALMLMNKGDYQYEAYDAHDYILGQKTKLPDSEWQNQEVKFDNYMKQKDWNRKAVAYW